MVADPARLERALASSPAAFAAREPQAASRHQARSFGQIAIFSGYFPSHGGGIELVCADLVRGLCATGRDVVWLALGNDFAGVDRRCSTMSLAGTDFAYRRWGIPFPLLRPTGWIAVWKALRSCRIAVIAEANFMVSLLAFLFARVQRKPVLLVQHVGAPSTVSRAAALMMRAAELLLVRPMLRRADQVIYVSPAVSGYFGALKTHGRAEVIGHGVDTDLFAPAPSASEREVARARFALRPDRPVACFAGRCTVSKGIEIFVRMARLRPDWQFVVAGDGPVAGASSDCPNLKWLGQVDRGTLAQLYRGSDVLVLPSRSESFSLVVREALACGTRVLCGSQVLDTDPALGRFLVTREVDLEQPAATASSFAEALDEPAPCAPAEARAYVIGNCSWPAIVRRYATLIDSLCRSTPR